MTGPTATLPEIERTIRRLAGERGAGRTICPSEVARALAGPDETKWRLLMAPIRRAAMAMAGRGEVDIRRKGRIVDTLDSKGVYRIGLPSSPASAAGRS